MAGFDKVFGQTKVGLLPCFVITIPANPLSNARRSSSDEYEET